MALSQAALEERKRYYRELHNQRMATDEGRRKYELRQERYWLKKAAERKAKEEAEAKRKKQ